ncbi:hypothetical protein D0Y65_000306 [Glycine soja]|uniref:Single-stranded DNA binding protein Ssb-like OB fold domain-containing protein n=1 Tax=Glycine soja TaxID=3848 RepID=A0A445LY46_GLYSO|nr:hypothetical protein D0Y65_000306 [Glycine soja]RZC28243.1 hypothetical protein D0Y65_000306 [Glycine soja]
MADSKPGLRKPVFTKVDQLRPGTSGHTLTVKVVDAKMVMQKGRSDGPQSRQMRIAECLVGDETGMIIFTARNDQGMGLESHIGSMGFQYGIYKALGSPTTIVSFCGYENMQLASFDQAEASEVSNQKRTLFTDVKFRKMDMMKEGATVTLRNAKIDMFKGSMRLAADKWGRVEVTEPASFTVKEDNNLSLIEYELVNVVVE